MLTNEQVQDTIDVNTALDRRLHEAAVRIFKQARDARGSEKEDTTFSSSLKMFLMLRMMKLTMVVMTLFQSPLPLYPSIIEVYWYL